MRECGCVCLCVWGGVAVTLGRSDARRQTRGLAGTGALARPRLTEAPQGKRRPAARPTPRDGWRGKSTAARRRGGGGATVAVVACALQCSCYMLMMIIPSFSSNIVLP